MLNNSYMTENNSVQTCKSPIMRFVRKPGRKNNRNNNLDQQLSKTTPNQFFPLVSIVNKNNISCNDVPINEENKYKFIKNNQSTINSSFDTHTLSNTKISNNTTKIIQSSSLKNTFDITNIVNQNNGLINTNKNLNQTNKKLQTENKQLKDKLKSIQQQLLEYKNNQNKSVLQPYSKRNTNDSFYSSQEINPFIKLKSIKKFNKFKQSQTIITSQQPISKSHPKGIPSIVDANLKSQFQERYYASEKNLFEARQQIKRLSLQLDCLRMKAFTDIENQKKKKSTEYLNLQKKFKQLLNEHIKVVKNAQHLQSISNRLKSTSNNLKRQEAFIQRHSSDALSIFSLSSDQSTHR